MMRIYRLLCAIILVLICNNLSFSQQLVLPGDHPDPSVVKIGDTYWASSTTSNWLPAFPLLKSKDLIHWEIEGHVFNQLPGWADYYFWAPEISYENGKVYIYYAAHKKNGNLCVGVASADKPEGPYKDHGPLVCQEDGSIDAFPMRDENGKLYLIWKEDANSIGKPTPIWAMEMNEDRTALIGQKKELFRNDVQWEGNLVEGVSMIRHGDYFYAIYAAAGCCGITCTYGIGVARAKSLLGPWEKYKMNPVLTSNEKWVCPGHGTAVEKDGRYYFLHHAYDKQTNVFTGRQGILSEFRFTPDNWIEFVKEGTTSNNTFSSTIKDEFKGHTLSKDWEWSVFQNIKYKLKHGKLQLGAGSEPSGTFIGQEIISGNYEVNTVILKKGSSAAAGLADIGDDKNIITALFKDNKINIVIVKDGKQSILLEQSTHSRMKIYLRMQVRNAKEIVFSYSTNGKTYTTLNTHPIDGSFLPPWDRAVRVGLVSRGEQGQLASFDRFEMTGQ